MATMDPYVVVKVGKQTRRTKEHSGGGKKPKWQNVPPLVFNKGANISDVVVEVKERDSASSDDLVGTGIIKVA